MTVLARLVAQPGGFGRLSDRRLRLAMDVPIAHLPPRPTTDPEVRALTTARLQSADHDGFHVMLREWDLGRTTDPPGRRKTTTAVATARQLLPAPAIWQAQLARVPCDP